MLLQMYFHHSYVTGLLRNVEGSSSKDLKEIGALKALSVVPSFPKDGARESSFILPLMIARYAYSGSSSHRANRKVVVPAEMDFNPFLLFEDSPRGSSFLLRLTGIVCHQGNSPHAGHYISFSFDDGELFRHSMNFFFSSSFFFFSFLLSHSLFLTPLPPKDDLGSRKRVKKFTGLREITEAFNRDIAADCYLLFFEFSSGQVASGDHAFAERLQQEELRRSQESTCSLQ